MGSSGNPARRAQAAADKVDDVVIGFDLDVFESERPVKEPFVVRLGGQTYALREAEMVDYRDLTGAYQRAELGDIRPLIRLLVPEEQREAFDGHDLPMDAVKVLMERYRKHFGLPAPGEARASRAF